MCVSTKALFSRHGRHAMAMTTTCTCPGFAFSALSPKSFQSTLSRSRPTLPHRGCARTRCRMPARPHATSTAGHILSYGYNAQGQLGTADTFWRVTPTLVRNMPTVSSVAAGFYHSLVATSSGHLMAFGQNENGQLGTNDTVYRHTPMLVHWTLSSVLFVAVCAGSDHSLAVAATGASFDHPRPDSPTCSVCHWQCHGLSVGALACSTLLP